jgi:N-acetylmuramoyl-L-alanine amidase
VKKTVFFSLLLMFASVLLFTQGPVKAESIQYEDVIKDDPGYGYAYDFIYYLTNRDVIHGYVEDGHYLFKPGNELTRAQAAIMLVKALGEEPLPLDTPSHFPDIKQGDPVYSYAYGYIQKAYELGIFRGHADKTFGPGEKLTRLQMAYTLVNAFKLPLVDKLPSHLKDVNQSSTGFSYINALYYSGISDGSNGLYMPGSYIKRAQFSVFVARGIDPSLRLVRTSVAATGKVQVSDGTGLNIRQEPNTTSAILGNLPSGAEINIYNQVGNWFQIMYNNAPAYVSAAYVTIIPPYDPNAPLARRIIVLDPGHGGHDPGAIALDGTEEQAINYGFATRAMSALQKAGATVIMTHQYDKSCMTGTFDQHKDLQCRVDVATKNHADVFISIHSNSSADGKPTTQNGTETHYNDFNDPQYPGINDYPAESKILANIIQNTIPSAIGMSSRGVIDDNLYVTRMNTVPAVLIELGFVKNSGDLTRLESRTIQENFGAALVKAMTKYFATVSTK